MNNFKKLLLGLCMTGFCLTNFCSGQSSFGFQNWVSGTLDAPVFDAAGNRLSGTSFVAMLYGGLADDTLLPAFLNGTTDSMTPVSFTYTPAGQAGYFREPLYVTIGSVSGGGLAWLQVRAWDTRLGGTYEAVAALGLGGYGESTLFQARGGDPFAGVPTPPGLLTGLQSFSLRPVVPEPSTWALVALGGAAVWWAARRKRQKP